MLHVVAPVNFLRGEYERLSGLGGRFVREAIPGVAWALRLHPKSARELLRAKAVANLVVEKLQCQR